MITISIVKNDFIIIVVLLNEIMKLVFFLVVVIFILEVTREYNEDAKYHSAYSRKDDDSCLRV